MIDPNFQQLSQLLKEDYKLVVPEYQRPYSWRSQEVGEFAEDIRGYIGGDNPLYLGTIILDISKRHQKIIEIVDGQQRLTTLFILLIACRDHAKALKETSRADATQRFIAFTDEIENKTTGMRLIASPAIREVFEHMADSSWDGEFPESLGKRPIKRVKPVYQFFRSELKDMNATDLGKFQASVYATRVIRINIDDKEEAFSIFERTNARGMDLEVADLLKNYLHAQSVTGAKETWKEILENSSHSMLRMLKSFYVSQRGYVQKAHLYRYLKKLSEELGGAVELSERLRRYSEFFKYSKAINTNPETTKDYFLSRGMSGIANHQDRFAEIHNSIQALRAFNVSQTQPLIYAAIECMERLGKEGDGTAAKAFVRMLQALEAYHFINTWICSHIGNEVEQVYAKACKDFTQANDFVQEVDKVVAILRKNLAPESEFSGSFVQLAYSNQSLARIAYIFDRLNNHGRKVSERKPMFYPDTTMFRKHYNVEHIAAQKGEEAISNVSAAAMNNIGNLVVLSVPLNSQLGSKSVEEKVKLLSGKLASRISEFPTLKDIVSDYEKDAGWSDSVIASRAAALARYSYTTVWKI